MIRYTITRDATVLAAGRYFDHAREACETTARLLWAWHLTEGPCDLTIEEVPDDAQERGNATAPPQAGGSASR